MITAGSGLPKKGFTGNNAIHWFKPVVNSRKQWTYNQIYGYIIFVALDIHIGLPCVYAISVWESDRIIPTGNPPAADQVMINVTLVFIRST